MRLAISNIAWGPEEEHEVFTILHKHDVTGIEVAPTRIWPDWQGADVRSATVFRRRLADEGFVIPAMQAILYGKPELQLFDAQTHPVFLEHMKRVIDLAACLGAKVLVFGAPGNRRRGQLGMGRALELAVDFMRKVGALCAQQQCTIGWEHNPIEYGCDFITNAADARELVDRIDSPGVQLHLDSAGLHLCGGDIARVISVSAPFVHYHASEPMLVPLVGGVVDHVAALDALRRLGYAGWVSIEMKKMTLAKIEDSVRLLSAAT